jgi:phytoene desaturase
LTKTVIVIGSGLGGLSAAIHLQHRGFSVRLFEKNVSPGGKMGEYTIDGYRFDTGPSLLTMPFVVEDLFKSTGANREDYLSIVPLNPLCRYFWEDGAVLDASVDIERISQEIAKFSPVDGKNYRAFLEYTRRIFNLTADIFLFSPVHEIKTILNWRSLETLLSLPQIDPLRSMHSGISRFFNDPRVVQLFDRFATYNGSNPYQAPATLNIIPFVEHGLEGYYIKGGMYQLVHALEKLALNLGVEIHTNALVQQIIHHSRQVQGVLVDDKFFEASYIVCNAEVVTAQNQLISGFPKRQEKLNRLEPSLSGMAFLWGVSQQHPMLAHHNIIFSQDYHREFTHIFDEERAPDDPTVYIAITAKTDPEHAPANGENWFVLLNMPYLKEGQDWEVETARMREAVFQKLRRRRIDISAHIETERVYTPGTFYQLYGSNRGSIYRISSNSRSTAFRRPANRSRNIEGLYFAGGSTHPGGGIPLVLLSGKITAKLIAEHAGKKPLDAGFSTSTAKNSTVKN